jgi:peptidoglycan/LPS O-acetylase OafA/YrhL
MGLSILMSNCSDTPTSSIAQSLSSKPLSYSPHLDGLRALAVLGVLFEHFNMPLPDLIRCGPLSVRFFFVLSGYFITLSLWKVQDEIRERRHGTFWPICKFYLSRLLRIGPPFYLALLIGAIFGIEEVRTNFFWLATFQANNYIAYIGQWPEAISHFWSLAVQEQFYVIWPLVVLTLPRRWFLPAMAAFIVFGLVFRLACVATNTSIFIRWVTLFGCIDSFAVGALVAYLRQARLLDQMKFLSRTVLFAMPLVAFGCFFFGRALMTLPETNIFIALTESIDAVFLAWALSAAIVGFKGPYARVLEWKPLTYLGRISYGVYVYHVFVIIMLSPLLVSFGMSEDHWPYLRIASLLVVTITISAFSWHYIEQPFLNWKKAMSVGGKPKLARVPVPSSFAYAVPRREIGLNSTPREPV